nr:unnamed protein product [Digitaria exilis]
MRKSTSHCLIEIENLADYLRSSRSRPPHAASIRRESKGTPRRRLWPPAGQLDSCSPGRLDLGLQVSNSAFKVGREGGRGRRNVGAVCRLLWLEPKGQVRRPAALAFGVGSRASLVDRARQREEERASEAESKRAVRLPDGPKD